MPILYTIIIIILSILIASFMFYRFWFLRNPKISVPQGNSIVSPANGRIARIVRIGEDIKEIEIKKHIGRIKALTSDTIKKGYLILIVMNVFNVHYQKAPIDGKVISVKHKKGKFLNAVSEAEDIRASFENEKTETIIQTEIGKIKIIQIAGLVARRIVSFVKPEQKVIKGQDIGLIKLGSQVVLIIPKLKLNIKEGQTVEAGKTIIAEY